MELVKEANKQNLSESLVEAAEMQMSSFERNSSLHEVEESQENINKCNTADSTVTVDGQVLPESLEVCSLNLHASFFECQPVNSDLSESLQNLSLRKCSTSSELEDLEKLESLTEFGSPQVLSESLEVCSSMDLHASFLEGQNNSASKCQPVNSDLSESLQNLSLRKCSTSSELEDLEKLDSPTEFGSPQVLSESPEGGCSSMDLHTSFFECQNNSASKCQPVNSDLSESLQNLSLRKCSTSSELEDFEKLESPTEFGPPLCTSTPKKSSILQPTTCNNQNVSEPLQGIESESLCELLLSESLCGHVNLVCEPSSALLSPDALHELDCSQNQDVRKDPYSFSEESGIQNENQSKISLYTSESSCDNTNSMEISDLSDFFQEVSISSTDDCSNIIPVEHVAVTSNTGKVKSKTKSSPKKSRKYKFKIGKRQLKSVLRGKCCEKKCIQQTARSFVKDSRRMYWSKSPSGRNQWLLDKINQRLSIGGVSAFSVSQELQVCQAALLQIHGISKSTFFRCRKDALSGIKNATPGFRVRMPTSYAFLASVWIERYASENGDRMPDREEVQLPLGTTKTQVYKNYMEECLSRNERYISESHFLKIWREQFSSVKIKKQYDNFSKCNKCALFQRALGRTQNVDKRRAIRLKRDVHINRQMTERRDYYRKRDLARRYSNKYLSLIIDGMDQSKTFIPHFIGRKAKAIRTSDLLKTHITTVLNHGERQQLSFLDKGEYPHDSNMTAAILLEALWIISKKGKPLPPILFLQADNCWRENKNRYILGLCEMMVSLEIFHEIHLSFLFVGHTHEDIDQYFSQLARHLRSNEAETLPGHTAPLQFKFTSNSTNKGLCQVDVHYRGSCTQDWKQMPNLLMAKPSKQSIQAKPKNVLPDFNALDLDSLDARISRWLPLFDPSDSSSLDWWKCFAAELKTHNSSERKRKIYGGRGEKWLLPKLSKYDRCQLDTPDVDADDLLGPHLVEMLTEESRDPEVIVGQKKQRKK